MQVSKAGRMRARGDPRFVPAVALMFWAAGALAFALLPPESPGRSLVAGSAYLMSAVFALACVGRVVARARGRERVFWGLIAAGMLVAFAGDTGWDNLHQTDLADQALSIAHVAYLVSYLLYGGALLYLVAATTRRITPIILFDALSVMLSVGTLAWFFLMEPTAAAPGSSAVLATLSWLPFDAALAFMGLVVFSTAGRPAFVGLLTLGFLLFAAADVWYLGARSEDLYRVVGWPDMLWWLGLLLLGSAALRSDMTGFTAGGRIAPWRVFAFWLGPLSPPLHLGLLLLWGAFHPPLPAYVLAACAALLLYLALRVALVSAVTRLLNREGEETARRLEQGLVLYELHDTVKGSVHGISLTLASALEAERRGERGAVREALDRAMEASRETEFLVSRPYDELRALANESPPRPDEFLRHRLDRFKEYFGVRTHEDLLAPLDILNPAEIAAVNRVAVEAFWNVAKHSGARNMHLESRRVGSTLIVRIRDDGRGFDPSEPTPGMGLRYLRRRAAEVGAELDVISSPGRGTTIQLRFEKG